ncbi:lasso peptide biosynthesis B2 protein [Priestia aryabhattai]|uniref:lasso peptide biosynthesis B2 protein n=1 Tax=Priestia TaxID=2800373 RepID=UPI00263B3DD4|nr:lasso peptide biosynthesis B2 protein [Priestia megaterium]MDN4861137.1 lasso peptide biosynthesis B2 protein [Priestia megaterium]
MNLIKRVRNFLRLETSQKILLIEAFYYLGYGRVLKALPFSKIAPTLGEYMQETSISSDTYKNVILKNISNAVYTMSKYTFWESQCLVKAIAGMKMLERRHIESTLYLGTAKDEKGKLIAHAWLRSGSMYVTGSEGMERFTVVGKFSKELNIKKSRKKNNRR